jgi:hypothetical protein
MIFLKELPEKAGNDCEKAVSETDFWTVLKSKELKNCSKR